MQLTINTNQNLVIVSQNDAYTIVLEKENEARVRELAQEISGIFQLEFERQTADMAEYNTFG